MLMNLTGALGLFLIGMWLMTEGLKMAGGHALRELLGRWTSSRLRGLGAGILITALVQSSGAVTIATIGFVNTGLMTFQQALWVVFGSNIGTTFTAWIVTFLGFSLQVDSLIYPLVGLGAALRVFAPRERLRSLGMALAGFGLLFMGIDALRETFAGLTTHIDVATLLASSGYPTLIAVLIGLVLTVLTQSSSASIAIILTAVATDVAPLSLSAAAVIGANIGSTSTALLATAGATANAKRLAMAHIIFNLVTASVALLLLPVFLQLLLLLSSESSQLSSPTILLALFHTSFNILGVLLMWPLEPPLSRLLLRLFSSNRPHQTRHLDANIATIPELAIGAVGLELRDLLDSVLRLVFRTTSESTSHRDDWQQLQDHLSEINHFIELTMKSGLTQKQGSQLAIGLSVSHYLHNACQTYEIASQRLAELPASAISGALLDWLNAVNEFSYGLMSPTSNSDASEALNELTATYRRIKQDVIQLAVHTQLPVQQVDDTLLIASLAKRYIEQVAQALASFQQLTDTPPAPEAEPEADNPPAAEMPEPAATIASTEASATEQAQAPDRLAH